LIWYHAKMAERPISSVGPMPIPFGTPTKLGLLQNWDSYKTGTPKIQDSGFFEI